MSKGTSKKWLKKVLHVPEQKVDFRKIVSLFLVFGAFGYLGKAAPQRVLYSYTDSLNKHLFYFKPVKNIADIRKDDFVVFKATTNLIPNCNPCLFVKRIGCSEGERLSVKKQGTYFCNNRFLGVAKEKSLKGDPLTPFIYDGPVPKDKIFASGTHKDSYDSRYFGFVEKEKIEGIAIPFI